MTQSVRRESQLGRLGRRAATKFVVLGAVLGACAPAPERDKSERLWTDDYEIRVLSDPLPPRAQDPTLYTIYVRDKKTREPIVGGEGRIFATNSDKHSVWQGFAYGPEVGTYHSRLKFITAGEWAMGVQFRRDSTTALQQSLDWRQRVEAATPLGQPDADK
ncbi:MAG: hypothetical protein O2973_02080 [Gemmatimonadetes bacterium]|nr:hypothetical protein [Gemmatimonadota bacterium]